MCCYCLTSETQGGAASTSTPDPPEMHVDEDDEHIDQHNRPNVGDTVASCAGGASAAHNTANTSTSTPLDHALLDTTCPNNSVNRMSTPPNPRTSSSERGPSPLSNPSDGESATGAPSSCPRKRKSAKNSTGKGKWKGKAPPKQRRKTAQGSRSARI